MGERNLKATTNKYKADARRSIYDTWHRYMPKLFQIYPLWHTFSSRMTASLPLMTFFFLPQLNVSRGQNTKGYNGYIGRQLIDQFEVDLRTEYTKQNLDYTL